VALLRAMPSSLAASLPSAVPGPPAPKPPHSCPSLPPPPAGRTGRHCFTMSLWASTRGKVRPELGRPAAQHASPHSLSSAFVSPKRSGGAGHLRGKERAPKRTNRPCSPLPPFPHACRQCCPRSGGRERGCRQRRRWPGLGHAPV